MSTTIDQRVVEMRFDNKHFERNVSTTMSTLDKLKQKLNLPGAAKSLEAVNAAVKKVDLSGISGAVDTVRSRFSAMEVMGVTALANITNSAVNAGKRIAAALTIDPVTTGFSEYELKMGSIQTIMASTGASLDEVNKYLGELNEYSDKTIYSFSDMTTNIGKFTNAGVKLPQAVSAIKGVSNVAALSGANANEASRAMYNFAQALSAGHVKLIDWKSIENANMATVGFKNELIKSAVAAGTLKDAGKGLYKTLDGTTISATKNFNESLQEQWMTTDVLIKTLGRYADETTDIGKKATNAAQDVKTWTQLLDTLKESAQSGWATTWELIFGDFEESKKFFTGMSKTLGGFIEASAKARNAFIEAAMGDNGGDKTGRELLLGSFENILQAILKPIQAIKKAWQEIFPAKDTGNTLYKVIEGFNKFTEMLVMSDDTLEDFTNTFKGLFVILDAVFTFIGGPVSVAFKVIMKLLKALGLAPNGILSVTGAIGEALVSFRDWLKSLGGIGGAAKSLIDGFVQGITDGVSSAVDAIVQFGKAILDGIKDFFGIHSPALTFIAIAAMCIAGLVVGLQNGASDCVASAKNVGLQILETIIDIFKNGANGVKTAIQWVLDNGVSGIINGLNAVGKGIWKAIGWIGSIFSSIFKNTGLDKMFETLSTDISEGSLSVWGALKKFGSKVFELLSKIDFGKILAVIMAIGSMLGMNRIGKGLEAIGAPMAGLGEMLENVGEAVVNFSQAAKDMGKGVKSWMKSLGAKNNAAAVKDLAIAIAILAAAVLVLSLIPYGKLWSAVGAVTVLALVIGGLYVLVQKMSTGIEFGKSGAKLNTAALTLLGIAASLLMVAIAARIIVKAVGEFDSTGDWIGAAGAFIAVIVGIMAICYMLSKMTEVGPGISKAGGMLFKLSLALLIMVGVVKLASMLSPTEMIKGVIFVGIFAVFVSVLIAVAKNAGASISKAGGMIFKVSLALLILIGVVKLAGMLSISDILKGTAALMAFGTFIAILVGLNNCAENKVNTAGKLILSVAGALIAIGIALRIMGGLDVGQIIKGIWVIGAFGVLIYALVDISEKAGPNISKIGVMALGFAGAVLLLTAAIFLLGQIDLPDLAKGMTCVLLLGTMFTALVYVSKDAFQVSKSIWAMAGAIAILTAIVFALQYIDPVGAAKGLALVGVLILLMAGLLKLCNFNKDISKSLWTLMGAIAILAAIVAGLSFLDPSGLATATIAISLMIGALAAILAACKYADQVNVKAKSLLEIGAIIAVLLGLVWVLSLMPDGDTAMKNAIALSTLLIAISGALAILAVIGKFAGKATTGIGALTAMIIPLLVLGGGLALLCSLNLEGAWSVIVVMTALISALTLLMIPLALVGVLSSSGMTFAGMFALTAMVVPLLALGWGLSVLCGLKLNGALSVVLAMSALIAALTILMVPLALVGVLSMSGMTFVGMLALTAMVGPLLALGWGLSKLCDMNLGDSMPVVEALVKLITSLSGVLIILAAVGALAVPAAVGIALLATLATGIVGFFTVLSQLTEWGFMDGLPKLGKMLSKFMDGVSGFIDGVKDLEESDINGITCLVSAIETLVTACTKQRWNDWLGGPTFKDIGTRLSEFGESAKGFVTVINGIKPDAVTAAQTLVDIVGKLAATNMTTGIFDSTIDLAYIGDRLNTFGTAMVDFSDHIKGRIDSASIQAAHDAAQLMVTLANNLPRSGGWEQMIDGTPDTISSFGRKLKTFGQAMVDFSAIVSEKGAINSKAIQAARDSAQIMVTLANGLPKQNGWAQIFDGEQNLELFGAQLEAFGTAMVNFSATIGKGVVDVATVESVKAAVEVMIALHNGLPETSWWQRVFGNDQDLDRFGQQLVAFGNHVSAFSGSIANVDSSAISNCSSAFSAVVDLANKASTANFDGLDDLKSACRKLAKISVSDISTSISELGESLKSSGAKLINGLIKGIESKASAIKTAVKSVTSGGASAASESYSSFFAAGMHVVSGFASGIRLNKWVASSAARAMAAAAAEAAKDELQEHSPSKVGYGIGDFFGIAFVNAISDNARKAYNASTEMAGSAKLGLDNAVTKLRDAINLDMDITPTISPVLDLSNVRTGANDISNMLNFGTSVGVSARASKVGAMMSGYRQNRGNGDVVSAIDKLKDKMDGLSNTTYNVNGVTYDDGSNVANAVGELVRAAKIDRRK